MDESVMVAIERLRARVVHYRMNVEFYGSQVADDIETILEFLNKDNADG